MAFKLVILSCLVAAACGSAIPLIEAEHESNPQYSYAYAVQDVITGDIKSQEETRSGDVVRGSYSLLDSDGLKRTVDYSSDPLNGFNAVVQREPVLAKAVAAPIVPIAAKIAAPSRVVVQPAAYSYSPISPSLVGYSSPVLGPISYAGSVIAPYSYTAPILAKTPLSYASTSSYSGPVGGLIAPASYGVSAAHATPILSKYAAPVLQL